MCYKQAIKYDPTNGEIYYNLGNCYFIIDDKNKAILRYEEAIKYNYNTEDVKLSMARAYIGVGDTEGLKKAENYLYEIYAEKESCELFYLFGMLKEFNNIPEAIKFYNVKV